MKLEDLHDSNELARREVERFIKHVGDDDTKHVMLESISAFYDLLKSRIERGYYSGEE